MVAFPASPTIGQTVTGPNNEVWVWDGVKWVHGPGSGGGGGANVAVGPTAPSSPSTGDLWFNTTAGVLNVWTGSAWAPSGGGGTSSGASPPSSPTIGALWFNTTTNRLMVWNGSTWVPAGGSVTISPSMPTSPALGDLWWDTTTMQLYIYDTGNNQWIVVSNQATGGGTAEPVDVLVSFSAATATASMIVGNVPMGIAVTVPAALAGTTVFASTPAAALATFTLNKISSGTTTALGTVGFHAGSAITATLAGPGGNVAVGDTIQLVAPTTADASLANFGVSVLAQRT